ncbi:hypothetical protein LBMAG42_13720 [Deltaproteobacteria bacterium]|nr:hypothetical protein LBMAG42_13720 [Deltaproteobacteria bacterium]
MLRWSDDTHTLQVAVRDLVGGRSELGGLAMSARARSRAGGQLHRRIQDEEEGDAEVAWTHVEEVEGWRCIVHARVDGLVDDLDGVTLIDEIKSVGLGERALMEAPVPESWRRQLQLYLHMAVAAKRPDPVGRLRLVSLVDGSQRVVQERPDPEVGRWLRAWLRARVRTRELGLAWRAERRLRPVPFPFSELRAGQSEILDATVDAVAQEQVLAVTAPTGLGKTAPVITGVLREAFRQDLGVFWATARGTQRWIVLDAVQRLGEAGLPLRVVVVPSRAEACPDCARGDCVGTAELADLEGLASQGIVTPEEVRAEAGRQGACAWALAVELAAHLADVVVADLNYAFDPDVYLRPLFASGAARRWTVVVDEAHQLPDRARGWASARVDAPLLDRVDASFPGPFGAPFRDLVDEVRGWLYAEAGSGEARRWEVEPGALDDVLDRFDSLAYEHARLREANPLGIADDPWRALGQAIFRFSAYAEHEGEEVVSLTDGMSLQLICRDASFLLRDRVAACASLIATSATLAPTWFWRERMGVPSARFAELDVPSNFPAENLRVIVARGVSTAFRDRAKERTRIAELVERCVAAIPGNVALFFGSFEQMNDLLGLMELPGRERVVQRPAMSHAARAEAAAEMAEPGKVLCAVLGGVFGESVDLPPGALAAAIIVGPAFPPPDLQTSLLNDWYERRHDDGFGLASVQPGMTRVVQAAGRVVRTPNDRGAVVLVCRRFLQTELQQYLPRAWVPEGSSKPWEELAAFFGQ